MRLPFAEQHHQDGEADRGFRGGHGQDEEHEHLPRQVAQVVREGDEVEIHREQHQLDAHQQQQHVLAIDEDAGDAQAEEDARQQQDVGQRDVHCLRLRVHLDHAQAILRPHRHLLADVLHLLARAVAHGQRDRRDDRDQQDHGRDLERIEVLRVQQLTERLRIGVTLGLRHRRGQRVEAELLHVDDQADLRDHDQRDQGAQRRIAREALAQPGDVDVEHHHARTATAPSRRRRRRRSA